MLKKAVTHADIHVEFDWYLYGSVIAGTVKAGATACRTRLTIESPESAEDVRKIVRLAKQGCFIEGMIQAPVPVTTTYILNGQEETIDLSGEPEQVD
jgi:organic hydroperoxide reductase OsmC/OhrA